MKQVLATLAMVMTVAACTSSADDDEGCADIAGNYTVKVTKIGGDCPVGGDGEATITIGSDNSGLYVVLPGIEGGCPGQLNAATCRFQAQCIIYEKGTSNTLVTYNLDYTFSGKTFTGSLAGAAAAGVISKEPCDSNVKHDGARL